MSVRLRGLPLIVPVAITALGPSPSDASPAGGHPPALAAAAGVGPELVRHVIAGGGGTSTGGAFRIDGTIGQADADPLHPATGGVFAVSGGFWPGIGPAAPQGDALFGNGFEPTPP